MPLNVQGARQIRLKPTAPKLAAPACQTTVPLKAKGTSATSEDFPLRRVGFVQFYGPQNPANAPYKPFEKAWDARYAFREEPARCVDLMVQPYNQNNAPDPETGKPSPQGSCGTTSLAMIMNHYRPGSAKQTDIDAAIRRSNKGSFVVPSDIVQYANRHGFRADARNNASVEDMVSLIDKGVPVQVCVEPFMELVGRKGINSKDAGLHYVVVSGYERDARTRQISQLVISDPWGYHLKLPVRDFMAHWENLRVMGMPTGLNCYMCAVVPEKGGFPRPNGGRTQACSVRLPQTTDTGDMLPTTNALAGAFMDLRNIFTLPPKADVGGLAVSAAVKGAGGLISLLCRAVKLPGLGNLIAQASVTVGDILKNLVPTGLLSGLLGGL